MTFAARTDANHTAIVLALKQLGYLVLSLRQVKGGAPDVLTWRRDKGFELVEIKGAKGTLTPDQIRFQADGWPVRIVRCVEDLL